MSEVFLELKKINKSYEGVRALRDLDLKIYENEVNCLAGGNGSGKSTLIKIISGVLTPDSGELIMNGKTIERLDPITAINMGVQVIYQDFALFPNLTVAENIALSTQLKNKAIFTDRKKVRSLALKALAKIDADIDPDTRLGELPLAGKQLVAISRAIINEPKLLILDEPTTALTAREVEKLWELIKELKAKGVTILLVDHKIDEVKTIADRLVVIRNGEFISAGKVTDYSHKQFIFDMTGKEVSSERYSPEASDETILRVDNICHKGSYENVSFSLKKGDVLGITGLLGSGRSEIGEALFGICPPESGEIILSGKKIEIKNIQDAVDNGIAYVPEDRLTEGLFTDMSVRENVIAASLNTFVRSFKPDADNIEMATDKAISDMGIVVPSKDAHVSQLSGGNAQKIVLSKWLNTNPRLIILNGPTLGVDVGAKADIHAILRKLASEGTGVIIISDDIPELVENCNKIIIVRNGKIAAETDNTVSKKDISDLLMEGIKGGDE